MHDRHRPVPRRVKYQPAFGWVRLGSHAANQSAVNRLGIVLLLSACVFSAMVGLTGSAAQHETEKNRRCSATTAMALWAAVMSARRLEPATPGPCRRLRRP
jgi:hypothetical protein